MVNPGALCVRPRHSLTPALSVSGSGGALHQALVLGPRPSWCQAPGRVGTCVCVCVCVCRASGAVCLGSALSIQFSALSVSGPGALCVGPPALSVLGPGALYVGPWRSMCRALVLCVGPGPVCVGARSSLGRARSLSPRHSLYPTPAL